MERENECNLCRATFNKSYECECPVCGLEVEED